MAGNTAIDPENRYVLAHAAPAAVGGDRARSDPGGRRARSTARWAGPLSSPTSTPICSRAARREPGPASRTTIRPRGAAASTSSRSAASVIRCSKRSISPTWSRSCDRRNRSTIAPQALLLMNNAFVIHGGRASSPTRLKQRSRQDADRQMDRRSNWRSAVLLTEFERKRANEFLQRWRRIRSPISASVIFNLNEFTYRQ